ncbi:unnamed protein product, partial [Prorocentrum cordatum]
EEEEAEREAGAEAEAESCGAHAPHPRGPHPPRNRRFSLQFGSHVHTRLPSWQGQRRATTGDRIVPRRAKATWRLHLSSDTPSSRDQQEQAPTSPCRAAILCKMTGTEPTRPRLTVGATGVY